jgi:hypothetical protein
MTTESYSGACLCGGVRFTVRPPTLFVTHCHCTMCQRGHGAAWVTWIGVPNAQLEVHDDDGLLADYPSSEHGTRTFCSRCGSTLFCRSTRHPHHTDVTRANIPGEIDREPGSHVYFGDRVSWFDVADSLPRRGGPGGTGPL